MKLIGSFIIFLSLSLIGKISSNKLSKRARYINMMIEILEFVKNEISYNMTSMTELIEKINKNIYFKKLDICQMIYKNLLDGKSVTDSWKISTKNSEISDFLKNDELDQIMRIGDWLGNSNIDCQISKIDSTINILKQKLKKAEVDKDKYYKIYNNLGVLSGIGLVILIW